MGLSNKKGDYGEIMIIADLMKRGYQVSMPYGHDTLYDLVVDREGKLERVQVKYTKSTNGSIPVRLGHDRKNKNGPKRYSAKEIDWIAVFDESTGRCYYVPSSEFADGDFFLLRLRLSKPKNNQEKGIRLAENYNDI